ncbi:MAG TPA: Ig-like domain-containing protein [Candidatus Sulfotelmatobacter sp.]|nr:Ig-like domain-containing protein [Candidatus Sulfotelmatobacter sp.]
MSVTLDPSSLTLKPGAQQQFTAAVAGSSNQNVIWAIDSAGMGNTTTGSITAAGLYTAPQLSGTHTITATSVADGTKSATATVTVQGSIAISPTSVGLSLGGTQQFTATVVGANNPVVTWSVDGVSGGNSSLGTIDAQGNYAAPSQSGTHTVAASVASLSQNATAAVTVVSLSISPAATLVGPGATQQFNANLQGPSNSNAIWSVDGTAGGNTLVGTINASGLYTAPNSLGPHTITAASSAFTSISSSSQVVVQNVALGAVLTYHNDDARDGAFTQETSLSPSVVNSSQFGKLHSYAVDGQIYA